VSAGHDPIIRYDPRTDQFDELAGEDVPLGVEPTWEFHEKVFSDLSIGSILVAGTDGIWEQRNSSGEMFGKERLYALVREQSAKSASSQQIVDAVVDALRQFRGRLDQGDDVTLVVVRMVS
jgi:sigma-B regulation protein RsbU (phosphoserine phosphatase)